MGFLAQSVGCPISIVQSLYNTPRYNMDLDIMLAIFYHGILQRNYRKMTFNWSFSYNCFVKIVPLYHTSLIKPSIPMDSKHSIIKGLHCNLTSIMHC